MLATKYLGLDLKSPIIAGSSGLTSEIETIVEIANKGVGAIVLKSLLEEQINADILSMNHPDQHTEAFDYISHYIKSASIQSYLDLIKAAKAQTEVPIIASINCISNTEWINFAKQIEEAGADALELNLFLTPLDVKKSSTEYEMMYVDITEKVTSTINIPLAIKLGSGITNLPGLAYKLKHTKAKGLVFFNKFYEPDIDIDKMCFTSDEVLSDKSEYNRTLRWVGIVSALVNNFDIAASTGIHSGETAIKQILAGAAAVQTVSSLYKNGPEVITQMNEEIKTWMKSKGFSSIGQFKGKLNYAKTNDTATYERAQFIKYFANKK